MYKKSDFSKKKSSKWKRRAILGILFFITITIFGGFLAVHTPQFRTFMLSKIDQRLKRDFNLSLSAKSLDLNLFRLRASFEDLKIKSLAPENSILESFFARKLTVDLSAVTLLGKKVHIQEFNITDPEVRLNMTKKVPSSAEKVKPVSNKPLSLRIDNLQLVNGRIDYQDRDYPITALINGIAIDIHFQDDDASHHGILTGQAGDVKIFESQFSLDKFIAELAFDDNSIQITRFHCATEPFVLDASGHIQDYQENPQYLFAIQGTLQMDFLNRISEIGQDFDGVLLVTTSIAGTGSELTLDGHVKGQDILVADLPLKRLEGDFQGDQTRIALHNLEIEDSGGKLKGELNLSFLEEGDSNAEFQWTSLRFSTFKHWMPESDILSSTGTSGYISAKWRERTLDSIDAKGEIRLESLESARSASSGSIDLKGNVAFHAKNGSIDVFPSSFHWNETELTVSGSLAPAKQFRFAYRLKSGDLKDAEQILARMNTDWSLPGLTKVPPILLSGELLLAGEASGSLEQPQATLRIRGRDIVFNTNKVGSVDADLTYTESTININSLSIGGEQSGIAMDGKIFFDPFEKALIPSAQIRLEASDIDIVPFASFLQEDYSIQGFLSGEAALSGKLTDPFVQFSTNLSNLSVNGEELYSIDLDGYYRGQELALERIHIVKDEGSLEGKFRLDLTTRTFDVNIEGRGIDLSSYQMLNPEEEALSGFAEFQLKGRGTVENPVFSLQLSMDNLGVQNVRVGNLILKAVSDGGVVDIEMETPLGKTSVKAKLILQEPYLIQGHLKTESIDIWHTIHSGLEPLPSPIGSQVSADADFVIPLRDWADSTLSLTLERASFRYQDLTILNQLPIVVRIKNNELIFEKFSLKGSQTEISVSGTLPLTEEFQGNVNVNGSINLRILEALLPGTEASGLLNIEGSLSGSLSEPVLDASVEMEKGRLDSSLIPLNFHDISLKSEIKENILFLDQLSIGVGGGNISAKGQISLSSLLPGDQPEEDMTRIQAQNEIIVTLSDLNLDEFAEILSDELDIQLGGGIEGTAKFKGDFTSLLHLEMDGELTRLEFSLDKFMMSNEEKILFGMRDGLLHLTKFQLSGGESYLQAEGEMSLFPDAQIDARLSASLDSAVISPFVEDAILGGNLSFDLNMKGALMSPEVSGLGKISDGFILMEDPSLLATNFNGTIDFPDTETVLLSLEGIINGGSTNIHGKIVTRSFEIVSTRFEVESNGVQVNYPEGFQALSDGTISLEKKETGWFLGGDIKITQSFYNDDIYPGGQLINTLRRRRRVLRSEIPPIIRSLNLDLELSTVDAFIIENNLAELELDVNIRVKGTVFDPRLSGIIRSRQTGQIVFGHHEYEVEQAGMVFQDADPLEGQLSVTAHTDVRTSLPQGPSQDLRVTLTISGTLTNMEFGLSSSPPPTLSEIELASILITGYGTERLRNDAAGVIGDQLMLYFLSPFASPFTNRVKNFLRAEEVSFEPITIASEEDPGARFTIRKGLIHALDLIYSIDISNTQNQTWILNYNINKNFALQSFAKDDGNYGASIMHRLFFGIPSGRAGAPAPQQYNQFIIGDIRLEGDLNFQESDLSCMSRSLKRGSEFSYRDLRKTIHTLEAFYKANDFLNIVIIPLLLHEGSDSITISLNISPNSPAAIVLKGDPLNKKLKREVIEKWDGRLPSEISNSIAKRQILRDLHSKGYLDSAVKDSTRKEKGRSEYVFAISLGPRYKIRDFDIVGESFITPREIKRAVSGIPNTRGKGLWALVSDFKRTKLRMEAIFSDYGYHNVKISPPQVRFDRIRKSIDMTLPIEQGIQSRISTIQIDGNSAYVDSDLRNTMSIKEGAAFSPTSLATDTNILYFHYRSRGYQDVKIDVQTLSTPDEAAIDLLFTIQEGEIHTINSIEVSGNQRTPEHIIRRELTFKEGGILRAADLISSQKKLYELMIFRTVSIRKMDIEGRKKEAKILVDVQEEPSFSVGYGLRYDSEEKLEVFGQLDLTNILGRGRHGMLFYRQNDRQKDLRFSIKDPYLFGKRFDTLYSFYYTEETISNFKEDLWGVSIQQQLKTTLDSSLSYLFRVDNTHSYELESEGPFPFDLTQFLPEFQTFWVRDTRVNILNANQGSFLSLSLTYSPEFLGTTNKHIIFFGQHSLYVPISSRVVWASNCRIGLADAFDQVLAPMSRRFFAGGAHSIRGFERDTVGPYSPILSVPIGGEALFVVNQELRFPLYKWFEGVAFFDFGNVYENLEDFSPWNVRTGAGFGLRLNIPAIFLRLDYGINLSPREYESKGVLYFSIGQAF